VSEVLNKRNYRFVCKVYFVLSLMLAATITTAQELSAYVLGAGDVVRIQVYGEDDLTAEAQLSDLGTISYPFLGELQVSGLTVEELQKQITDRLQEGYLLNPDVNIVVSQYREFYVNGQVASPGGFPFQPGLTIRKAISLAGGFTDRAAKSKIYLLSDSESEDASPIRVKLSETIRPGDVITVKERFF